MLKMLGTALAAGILVLSLAELSCLAAKHPRAEVPQQEQSTARVPPDLPLGSEEDASQSASPVLTR